MNVFGEGDENMKKVTRKNLIYIILAVLGAAENNTGMEIIKMNGTFENYGDVTAKNLTATVIFTDTAHNKVVRKIVKEGIDLLPDKEQTVEFYTEYQGREPYLKQT